MSYSYNHVTLVGRLVKDPEMKELSNGVQKASFNLAINRLYRKEDGTTDTDFIPIILWGRQAELCAQLLKKGTPVLVWGKIQVSRYEKNNEFKWITDVVADNFQVLERLNKSLTSYTQTQSDVHDGSERVVSNVKKNKKKEVIAA